PALILLGVATAACGAVGWAAGLSADEPTPMPRATTKAGDDTFTTKIQPFLKKYCIDCHGGEKPKGDVSLDVYMSEAHARKDRKNWADVQHALAAGEMPPPKSTKPKPTKDEKAFVIDWIENTLTKVDCSPDTVKDPGRVTIRRLNRAEYNNTVRDLCGTEFKEFKPADDFPSDDVGYGFDNIGDVLSFQPILLEKYMAAADKVLAEALYVEELP